MVEKISLGSSNFREIREAGFYYVDKSVLISELLRSEEKVILLPRPRRFGKTLNLSMLYAFFDDRQQSDQLFEGLSVSQDPHAMAALNGFPTVLLSFKDSSGNSWENCQLRLREIFAKLLVHHLTSDILEGLTTAEQAILLPAMELKAPTSSLATVLLTLSEVLHRARGTKVILLIDEYDLLIHKGHHAGFYAEAIEFMRALLTSAFKDNDHLERAVITGILRVAKESIYSGLNNLAVYTLLDQEFSSCFGFTEVEVAAILAHVGLSERLGLVQKWYNGYQFGDTTVYNPWSIMFMASHPKREPRAYWIQTSDNLLVRDLIQRGGGLSLQELEQLLAGNSVEKEIDENTAMSDLTPNAAWQMLLFGGYLTARSWNPTTEMAQLAIPNLEIQRFFRKTIGAWLGGNLETRNLIDHLLDERLAAFAEDLATAVKTILSYHDTAGKRPERVYHVFMVGLLAHLRDRYTVSSNRETGDGRADLTLTPRKPGGTGFIFEFKSATKGNLEALAKQALKQIEERDYGSALREAQVTRYVAIGLAFRGKRIALASFAKDLVGQARSAVQLYSEGAEESLDERSVLGALECSAMADRSGTMNLDEVAKKSAVVGQVQLLQQLNGETVLPLKLLLQIDSVNLEELRDQLKTKLQQAN